jgi:hypothetical protein
MTQAPHGAIKVHDPAGNLVATIHRDPNNPAGAQRRAGAIVAAIKAGADWWPG